MYAIGLLDYCFAVRGMGAFDALLERKSLSSAPVAIDQIPHHIIRE